ncbi:LysE family translocator [Cognatishimia activa]|uniref:LysE family translocator n=1 Tax=Cognatishimia activa TaxID=1715691 RepID=UPI00222F5B52|nr:LysE family translocator [Cognatishimia activa]UZD90106.1 LysE family translocator [Cognatishimia activa]
MTIAEILTFAIVAGLLVMSPGPNGVLIARTVPTSGRQAGFANVLGFIAAFYLHGIFSILGLSLLLMQSATLFAIVKYLGAAYLCWIGIRSLGEAFRKAQYVATPKPAKRERTLRRSFIEGFLTNALNPKVSMFYIAAFPQFITVGETTAATSFMLVTVHALINAIWFGAMVLLLTRLTKIASGGGFQRWLKGITGVVFIGFGAKLATVRAAV